MDVIKFTPAKLPLFIEGKHQEVQLGIEGSTDSFKWKFDPDYHTPEGLTLGGGGLLVSDVNHAGHYDINVIATADATGEEVKNRY